MPELGEIYTCNGKEYEIIAFKPRDPENKYELLKVSGEPPFGETKVITETELLKEFTFEG